MWFVRGVSLHTAEVRRRRRRRPKRKCCNDAEKIFLIFRDVLLQEIFILASCFVFWRNAENSIVPKRELEPLFSKGYYCKGILKEPHDTCGWRVVTWGFGD